MKRLALIIALSAGTAYACPGDSFTYSPNPGHPNFNPLHPDYDYDGDGIPNSEDDDIDGDGVPNCTDLDTTTDPPTGNFEDGVPIWVDCPPWNPCIQEGATPRGGCWSMAPNCDSDLDGTPNNQDDDDDDDGVDDVNDPDHPSYDPTHPQSDPDCDGIPNFEDDDDDNDGIPDDEDDNDTCPDEGDPEPPDDGPPDPPEPPDAPIEPIIGDPPPPPPAPDPPDDPDPPTEPEPPGPNPDPIPQPPIDDECCEAICTRLDAVIMWLDLNTEYQDLMLDELHAFRSDFYNQMNRFINGETGRLDQITQELAYANVLTLEDRELQYDQTFYLSAIYEMLYAYSDGDPDPTDLDTPDPPQLNAAPTTVVGLHQEHQNALTEFGHDFTLPDIENNEDESDAPVLQFQYTFTGMLAPMPDMDISVDLEPYSNIRILVHAALYLLIAQSAAFIVWSELKKQ